MKEIEMIYEWQWDNEEIKMLGELNKIKKEYAKKVVKFMEKLPTSQHRLALQEASDPSYAVYCKVEQMDKRFCTKEKEIR